MQVRNLVEGRWNFEQTRRTVCPPWGLWGGGEGDPSAYLLRLPGENDFKMMVGAHIPVPLHASAIVRTGGGGGWGDPRERDPELVRADVMEELVSREAAREQIRRRAAGRLYGRRGSDQATTRGNKSRQGDRDEWRS